MKTILVLSSAAIMLAVCCTGCVNAVGVANGYGYTPPALVYSNMNIGSHTEPNYEYLKRPYEVLGRVEGESSMFNVLLITAYGDGSCLRAEQDALRKMKNADALINRTFSIKHHSILSLFTQVTNCVSGDAIRYTDEDQKIKK